MKGVISPLIKLVVFLVITAALTYVLGTTIANTAYGKTNTYHAEFTDVTGLNLNDDVRIAGVRVGTVKSIELVKGNANHPSYSEITFTVLKQQPLPSSAEAQLRYRNLVGQRYLNIEQPAGDSSDPVLKPGGTIPLSHTQDAVDLTVLFNGFSNLTSALAPNQINELSYSLIQTLQGESGSLSSLLQVVASLTNTLADKDKVIGEVIDNLTTVLDTVAARDSELTNLIVQLRHLLSGLAADRYTIGNSIDGINNLATSTAGLLKQVRPPLKKDIVSLTGLTNTLNNSSGVLAQVIKDLPTTVAPLIRTASYGSWFNFYLCNATVSVKTGSGSNDSLTLTGPELGLNTSLNKVRGCTE